MGKPTKAMIDRIEAQQDRVADKWHDAMVRRGLIMQEIRSRYEDIRKLKEKLKPLDVTCERLHDEVMALEAKLSSARKAMKSK